MLSHAVASGNLILNLGREYNIEVWLANASVSAMAAALLTHLRNSRNQIVRGFPAIQAGLDTLSSLSPLPGLSQRR